jgi:hypothetical protein
MGDSVTAQIGEPPALVRKARGSHSQSGLAGGPDRLAANRERSRRYGRQCDIPWALLIEAIGSPYPSATCWQLVAWARM